MIFAYRFYVRMIFRFSPAMEKSLHSHPVNDALIIMNDGSNWIVNYVFFANDVIENPLVSGQRFWRTYKIKPGPVDRTAEE